MAVDFDNMPQDINDIVKRLGERNASLTVDVVVLESRADQYRAIINQQNAELETLRGALSESGQLSEDAEEAKPARKARAPKAAPAE